MNTKNEKTKFLKKILCFSASFVICFSSFIVPSYAVTPEFLILPQTNKALFNDGGNNQPVLIAKADVDYVYYFGVDSGSTKICYLVCDSSNALSGHVGTRWVSSPNSTAAITMTSFQDTINQDFAIRSYNAGSGGSGGFFYDDVNVFSSLNDGLSALRDFLDNGPTSSEYPLLYDYDIPNGNVAYIQAANAGDTITVSATFPQQSTLFSDSWSPMTMKYNWAPLSSGGVQTIHTSFPYSGQLDLPLVKSRDTNLLGQSKTGSCTFTQIASNSLEIYNPSYRQVNASNQDQYLLNPSIHIHCDSGFIALSVYPLKESLTPGGITASSDPANVMILQHTENSTPEDPQSEWVGADTTSSTTPPTPGGNNELPETFTIGDYINKLHDTLSNFAKSIISLLEQPIEHISDLIQAGSGFMSALRGMYAWLPVDIQGLVISALTVVIGIGVFKVFL